MFQTDMSKRLKFLGAELHGAIVEHPMCGFVKRNFLRHGLRSLLDLLLSVDKDPVRAFRFGALPHSLQDRFKVRRGFPGITEKIGADRPKNYILFRK